MEPSQVIGAPEWIASKQEWNFDGKVAAGDVTIFARLSRNDQIRMVQTLLTEHFHLKTNTGQRRTPVYELVVGKGGPKLKQATLEETRKGADCGRQPPTNRSGWRSIGFPAVIAE